MRAVVVMFDSLNRRMLPPYGAQGVHAPNFERLAGNTVAFENCYAGSMPCMPARREMHTGRYNFLHRSWGPLEPFDDSMPEILKSAGIYTHIVTDHQHYWEDGGATYHTRYNTHEFFRGQEGDNWKGHVQDVAAPESLNGSNPLVRQDWINRQYLQNEADHPQTRTFDAGLEFMETNREADNWLLQIECFDPHEPFFSYDDYRAHYDDTYDGVHFDWPSYRRVTESVAEVEHAKNEYLSLLSMCDASLGRVLDAFDEQNLWEDTLLIVCTDHGFLLGEQGWWGKSVQPWFDQNIHTPLFIWDPRSKQSGTRRDALVQTIDFAPTVLDFFGLTPTPDMQGKPLARTIADDTAVREGALFGIFGAHVNVTDGRYVYMRACATKENAPLFDYTLMPTHMRSRFAAQELQNIELAEPFTFTKGVSPLKVPGWVMGNPYAFGTLLFDLHTDPEQQHPLRDDECELRMANLMLELMRANDAPREQYERLGLPRTGPASADHLLVERQWGQMQAARTSAVRVHEMPDDAVVSTVPLSELLDDSRTGTILLQHFPALGHPGLRAMLGHGSVLNAAAMQANIGAEQINALEGLLAEALRSDPMSLVS
ncbi:sulfatase [Arthrobacter sp. GMC3]|uniref:sulfatase n=1 Tax=Arthrobacter sp. GMC3 TaxID=2058894 RepID=UPI000CE486B7|nr:sulfatase [Arthrobacter sp. GMC3]